MDGVATDCSKSATATASMQLTCNRSEQNSKLTLEQWDFHKCFIPHLAGIGPVSGQCEKMLCFWSTNTVCRGFDLTVIISLFMEKKFCFPEMLLLCFRMNCGENACPGGACTICMHVLRANVGLNLITFDFTWVDKGNADTAGITTNKNLDNGINIVHKLIRLFLLHSFGLLYDSTVNIPVAPSDTFTHNPVQIFTAQCFWWVILKVNFQSWKLNKC